MRSKDLRKAIDALYKRVDKHFGDATTSSSAEHALVLKTVWNACEEEMQRLTVAWKELIAKCYPVSGGVSLRRWNELGADLLNSSSRTIRSDWSLDVMRCMITL